jgi:hypothetical protein
MYISMYISCSRKKRQRGFESIQTISNQNYSPQTPQTTQTITIDEKERHFKLTSPSSLIPLIIGTHGIIFYSINL